jgi:hypothetical protein
MGLSIDVSAKFAYNLYLYSVAGQLGRIIASPVLQGAKDHRLDDYISEGPMRKSIQPYQYPPMISGASASSCCPQWTYVDDAVTLKFGKDRVILRFRRLKSKFPTERHGLASKAP